MEDDVCCKQFPIWHYHHIVYIPDSSRFQNKKNNCTEYDMYDKTCHIYFCVSFFTSFCSFKVIVSLHTGRESGIKKAKHRNKAGYNIIDAVVIYSQSVENDS